MKYFFTKFMIFLLCIFFYFSASVAEGFAAGTLIKVLDGYAKIEDLESGDYVVCYDEENNFVESNIVCTDKKIIDSYMRIEVSSECVCVSCDQKLYNQEADAWFEARSLKNNDIFNGYVMSVELIHEPVAVHCLSVARQHNFFVTSCDICAHNFFLTPFFVVLRMGTPVKERSKEEIS